MEINGYISKLYEWSRTKNEKDLKYPLKIVLFYFMSNESISTYKIDKSLKKTEYQKAYATLNKNVKRLKRLGFLREINFEDKGKRKPPHNAIYYRLSSFGVYYVVNSGREVANIDIAAFFKNYHSDILFKIFLERMFERETIKRIHSLTIINDIIDYLRECCFAIKWRLPLLFEIDRNKAMMKEIDLSSKNIPEVQTDPDFIFKFLNDAFDLKWVGKRGIKFERVNDQLTVKSSMENTLTIAEEKEGLRITWKNGSKLMKEFFLDQGFQKPIRAYEITPTSMSEAITEMSKMVSDDVEYALQIFVFKFLKNIQSAFQNQSIPSNEFADLQEDLKLLNRDRKYSSLIDSVRTDFFHSYDEFRGREHHINEVA